MSIQVLDSGKYRVNLPLIASMLNDKDDGERLASIGKLALITGVPIVIVAKYIQELYGDIPGLAEKTESLMKFYQVERIL